MEKVIDFHFHVAPLDNFNPVIVEYFRKNCPYYIENFSENINPDDLVRYLHSQGVDKGVLLTEYAPKTTGVVTNESVSSLCQGQKDLIPFGALCLYDDTPVVEQAEHAVQNLGMKGFKMVPTYAHFYPNDPKLFPFYELVQDMGVPLQFHTGISLFKGARVKYGDPLFLDDVADEFPDLKIILDHGGRSFWYDRANWLITRHKNMYIGVTGVPARDILQVFPNLKRYPDRFIFGSDWPAIPDIHTYVEKVRSLPLDNEILDMLLWQNAASILELE